MPYKWHYKWRFILGFRRVSKTGASCGATARGGIPTFLADLSYARQMIIFSRVSAKAFFGFFFPRVSANFFLGVFLGVFFWCF